jgi:hypothetical protein
MENAMNDNPTHLIAGAGTTHLGGHHHQFFVDLEGDLRPWSHSTITPAQVRELAGWPDEQQLVLIDRLTNEETSLSECAVVELLPGKSFGRKFLFKRGLLDRVEAELLLLREQWPDLRYAPVGQWVLIPAYPLPEQWSRRTIQLAFQIPNGPAGNPPYGFYAEAPLSYGGQTPTNYSLPAPGGVPFPGTWGLFSWAPDGWPWAEEPAQGANMRSFAQSFARRFAEGA